MSVPIHASRRLRRCSVRDSRSDGWEVPVDDVSRGRTGLDARRQLRPAAGDLGDFVAAAPPRPDITATTRALEPKLLPHPGHQLGPCFGATCRGSEALDSRHSSLPWRARRAHDRRCRRHPDADACAAAAASSRRVSRNQRLTRRRTRSVSVARWTRMVGPARTNDGGASHPDPSAVRTGSASRPRRPGSGRGPGCPRPWPRSTSGRARSGRAPA